MPEREPICRGSGRRSAVLRPECVRAALVLAACLALATPPTLAADNTATGDVGGNAAGLADSNTFVLNAGNALTLVKRAFLTDGTPVPDTSSVPRGSELKFMIYISNGSSVEIHDVSVQDVLDAGFAYVNGTLQVDNSEVNCATPVCSAAREGDVFTAVSSSPILDEAANGADVVSYTAGTTTVDAGDAAQGNARLDIAGSRVWALLFSVRVQ